MAAAVNPLRHTEEVLARLSSFTDKVVLFYSCGKDSIALLHLCRKRFKEVVCVYMEFVPGLTHNQRLLDHVAPNKLLRLPHWMTSHYIANNYMRIHNRIETKKIKLADVEAYARAQTGIEWIVTGMKQSDSLNRRLMMRNFDMQAIQEQYKKAHPLSVWKNSEVLSYIKQNRLPQPIKYVEGRSQGIDLSAACLAFLKKHHPADYQKILKVFPLADSLLIPNVSTQ